MSTASWLPTFSIPLIISISKFLGINPAPIPWILWGPGSPPEITGLSSGSTAINLILGFFFFNTLPTPVIVPPVPTPEMRTSKFPFVSSQISSAVVFICISGLAGFSNCWGIIELGVEINNSSARATAPFIPFAASVSSILAPKNANIFLRSRDILSGIVNIKL